MTNKSKQNNNRNKNQPKRKQQHQKKKSPTQPIRVQTVVVTKRTPPGRPTRGYQQSSGPVGSYLGSFRDPFNPRYNGVKIPDPYASPTSAFHYRYKTTMVLASGASNCAFVVYPHPLVSMMDLTYGLAGAGSTNFPNTAMAPLTANPYLFGITTPTELFTAVGSYRVVNASWKIRVEMPELTRTGDITIAPLLFGRNMPGYNALTGQAMTTNGQAFANLLGGMPANVVGTAALLEFPGAQEFSLNDMANRDITLTSKIVSSSFTDFHTSSNSTSYGGAVNFGDTVLVNNTTGATLASGLDSIEDVFDPSGMSGFAVYLDGLPTSGGPVISLECIMRIEGTPIISSLGSFTGMKAVPSGATTITATRAAFDAVMDEIDRIPGIRTTLAKMATGAISSAAQSYISSGRHRLM